MEQSTVKVRHVVKIESRKEGKLWTMGRNGIGKGKQLNLVGEEKWASERVRA